MQTSIIHLDGLDEGIRCALCKNQMKSERGCDGGCSVNEQMYKNVTDMIRNQMVKWIPVDKEHLPNQKNCSSMKVWLSFTTPYTSYVKSAFWVTDHFEWSNGRIVKDIPTAWMPYVHPEPYIQEEEK